MYGKICCRFYFIHFNLLYVVELWRGRLRRERKSFLCRCKCLCIQHESANWDGVCYVPYCRRTAILRGHLSQGKARTFMSQLFKHPEYFSGPLNQTCGLPLYSLKRSTDWANPTVERCLHTAVHRKPWSDVHFNFAALRRELLIAGWFDCTLIT